MKTMKTSPACERDGVREHRTSGFTLIEIAVALAVVAIGILSLFALISSALDSSATAVAETHVAVFADDSLSSLRSFSLKAAERGDAVWLKFWDDFRTGATNVPVATSTNAWPFSVTKITMGRVTKYIYGPLSIRGDNVQYTIVFTNTPYHEKSTKNLVDHSMRYRIRVDKTSDVYADQTNITMNVTMKVWPGEFGTTNNPLLFSSRYDNPGDL